MASQRTREVLQSLRVKDGNSHCFECDSPNPQWVSVSYGVFLCLQCSGQHRGLGTHISFVRSTTMDKWKESELQKMKVGGNRKAKEFFNSHTDVRPNMSLQEKYNTKTAALYRDKILTLSEGGTWTENSSSAQNYKPPSAAKPPPVKQDYDQDLEDFLNEDSHTFGNTGNGGGYSGGGAGYSEGGPSSTGDKSRYVGFGNTPVETDKDTNGDDDALGKAWSSMQTGWSSFTTGATNLAHQAGGGMSKLGTTLQENVLKPSANQASKFGTYVNESVVQPTKTKVNEGTLWTDFSSSAGQFATKMKTGSEKGWSNLVNWVQSTREGEDGEHQHPRNDNDDNNGSRLGEYHDEEEKEEKEIDHNVSSTSSNGGRTNATLPQQPLLIDFTDDPITPSKQQNVSKNSGSGYGGTSTTQAKKKQDDWNSWGTGDDGWGDWGGGGKND